VGRTPRSPIAGLPYYIVDEIRDRDKLLVSRPAVLLRNPEDVDWIKAVVDSDR
jgi:hypothetical protein